MMEYTRVGYPLIVLGGLQSSNVMSAKFKRMDVAIVNG